MMTETVHTAATTAAAALAAPRLSPSGIRSDATTLMDRLSAYQTAVVEDRTIIYAQTRMRGYAAYDSIDDYAAAVAADRAITGRTGTDLPEHWTIAPTGVITITYRNGDAEEAPERIYKGIARDAAARTI